MKTLLYPYHHLETYSPDHADVTQMASVASSLLYFDSVTMSRLGSPEQLGLPTSIEEISFEMQKIEEEHGIDAIDAWFGGYVNPKFSCDNVAVMNYLMYRTAIAHFEHSYRSLIKEGVIEITSLVDEFPDVTFDEFVKVMASFDDWPASRNEVEILGEAISDSKSIGLSAFYLREKMKQGGSESLQKTDRDTKAYHWKSAFLLDLFSQSLVSAQMNLPLTSFSDVHFDLRRRCVLKLQEQKRIKTKADVDSSDELLKQKIFSQALIALPAIIPKSPEAILVIRQKLSDELQEFRGAVNDLAEDMQKDGATSLTEKDIANMVKEKFVRPTESLKRKLANPGRDVIRNLITDSSTVGGSIVASLAMARGFGAPEICAAVIGVAVPTLTVSLKTLIERRKQVEQSGLSFIMKAQQINSV